LQVKMDCDVTVERGDFYVLAEDQIESATPCGCQQDRGFQAAVFDLCLSVGL
jgi:hypothetical protein